MHATKLWPFVQAMRALEESAFGDHLQRYKVEIKGHRLLDRDRFKWASQDALMEDVARRKHSVAFLNRGLQSQSPTRQEFTAYGQACLMMARGIFELLTSHGAVLFAVAIPRSIQRPATYEAEEYLRKDQVFLLERYSTFSKRGARRACWFLMRRISPKIGILYAASKDTSPELRPAGIEPRELCQPHFLSRLT